MDQFNTIKIINAKQNNLRNINVDIIKHSFTTVTGVSGSGKSSLVFDVLYAEGQKKLLEINNSSMSYVSNSMNKANVDSIMGLNPVIALEQKKNFNNPRSTVGTLTGIYNMIRSLYALIGTGACPVCKHKLPQVSFSQLVGLIMKLPDNYKVELRCALIKKRKKSITHLMEEIKAKLITQVYIDGVLHSISDLEDLEQYHNSNIEILLDRFSVRHDLYKQCLSSITIMLEIINNPFIRVIVNNEEGEIDELVENFYHSLGCCEHHYIFKKINDSELSFNNSKTACSNCFGVGISYRANPDFMVIAPHKGIYQGALHKGIYNMTPESLNGVVLYTLSQEYGFDLYQPYEELPDEIRHMLMYGNGGKRIKIINMPGAKRISPFTGADYLFQGFVKQLEEYYMKQTLRKASGESIKDYATKQCMIECECPECNGTRMESPYLAVKVFNKNIYELTQLQFDDLKQLFIDNVDKQGIVSEAKIIFLEINRKLSILCEIGLYYLSLDRRSDTLSGGEMQRIKLSSQIGSNMTGLIFVMDEPSIGLHAKDVSSLIKSMRELGCKDNTMIVVEHNLDVIRESDNVIEIGPGSGANGGTVVFNGTYQELLKNKDSLTKQYLLDINKIKPRYQPREKSGLALKIIGARQNNLKNINVEIPLNQFVCITGVSGSGKSTLINMILVRQLQLLKNRKMVTPGEHDRIEGLEYINNVINIDQKMIGTSSVSNPATYMNLFDSIRNIYAELLECKEKGYIAEDFSLTKENGLRCHNCNGKGFIVSSMQYMPDIVYVCPVCQGSFYSSEVKQFKYKEKDISEVLSMSVQEAYEFFCGNDYLRYKLSIMIDLGLGYLKLGQHTSTISGGEAQRINLAYELSKKKGKTHNLYVFDEPSVGLHPADIERLIYSINRLVDTGNSVIVIEHDLDIIKTADHVIDIGPDGGAKGGRIISQGTPFEVSQTNESYTGRYLKQFFSQ